MSLEFKVEHDSRFANVNIQIYSALKARRCESIYLCAVSGLEAHPGSVFLLQLQPEACICFY